MAYKKHWGSAPFGPDDPDCDVPFPHASDIEHYHYSPAVDDPDVWDCDRPRNDLRLELIPSKYLRFVMTQKTFIDRITAGTNFKDEPYAERFNFFCLLREPRTRKITIVMRRSRVLGDKAIGYRKAFWARRRRGGQNWQAAQRERRWEEQHTRRPL